MNCIGQASWKTKEDMLQDLTAIGQTEISDDFLVIGQQPPPPLRDDVDDEYDLRFGGNFNAVQFSVKPDLKGIQQCLRMVDALDEEELDTAHQGEIVLSKLNPLVKEFVPKSSEHNKSQSKGSPNSSKENNKAKLEPLVESDVKTEQSKIVNSIPKDIADKTNELRNKISENLKSDSPIHKKERNVAIANLLKLHAAKPSPSTSKSNVSEETEIKLITPEYFSKSAKDTGMQVDIDTKTIKESIEKVNNWLEPKSTSPVIKPAISSVCLGPVSFKRKGTTTKSPSGSTVDTKVPKSNPTAQFRPSQFADDLAKKYMARTETKEEDSALCHWGNLDVMLKKKDEELIKKKANNRRD